MQQEKDHEEDLNLQPGKYNQVVWIQQPRMQADVSRQGLSDQPAVCKHVWKE